MPIRINLLAEAQALDEQRRKDPVKRAMFVAVGIVVLAVLWCVSLQLKIIVAKSELNRYTVKWDAMKDAYQVAAEGQRKLIDTENKLDSLANLRTNRFLWGTALNALQSTLNNVQNVQVVHLKTEQQYILEQGAPPRTNGTQVIRGTPDRTTEKISISVDAIDANTQPGSQVSKLKESILAVAYFKQSLQQTNGVLLTSLSPPQTEGGRGKPFVKFTMQCFFPEKVR